MIKNQLNQRDITINRQDSTINFASKSQSAIGSPDDEEQVQPPAPLSRSNVTYKRFMTHKARLAKMKAKKKPKVTAEQLKAVIYAVFSEADEDGNGDLDINECRIFCRKLMSQTYPDMPWDEERYKQGFYGIDVDKGGSIDFEEMFKIIHKNAMRQNMIVGSM